MSTGRTPAATRRANLYQLHWVTVSVATTCRRSVSLWMGLCKCEWESKILINKIVVKSQNCSYNNQISLRAIRYSIPSFLLSISSHLYISLPMYLVSLNTLFCLLAVSLYLSLPWTNLHIIYISFSTTLNISSIINCSPSSLTIRPPGCLCFVSLTVPTDGERGHQKTHASSLLYCLDWNILTHKLMPLRETVAQWPLPWSNSMVQSGKVPRHLKNRVRALAKEWNHHHHPYSTIFLFGLMCTGVTRFKPTVEVKKFVM